MAPKNDVGAKKGKPGDDGGSSGVIQGSVGNDVLRGTRGNDVFQSYTGDDEIYGRGGYDTLVVDGSVWDYSWQIWGGNWELWDKTNFTGDVVLYDVEEIQFNDYTIVLGEELPLEILTAPPERLVVQAGGEASFDFVLRDMDDHIDVKIANENEIAYGSAWLDPNYDDSIYGKNSQEVSYTFNYDYDRYYQDYTGGPVEELAEGEEYTITITLDVKTSDFWLDADDPGRGEFHELTFDLVIVGENEAPTILGSGEVEAVEDAGETRFDLSGFGADIDTDDDGSSLTYEIVSADGGLDVWIDGAELVLTANSLLDTATSDEVATGEVVIRAIDRHGAATEGTVTIDLTVRGIDDTPAPPDYLLPDGTIDFAALGVPSADQFDFGAQIVDTWFLDEATMSDLRAFTDDGDVKDIKAGTLGGFDDSLAFVMGNGDDRFVFQGQSETQSYLTFVDIEGGYGEDVVVVTLDGGTEAVFQAGLIDTGAQSDRVLLQMEFGYKGWWNNNISTGSGHDVVDMRFTSDGPAGAVGEVLMVGSVDLGSGDDILTLVADAGGLTALQKNDFSIYAGDGDDAVSVDISGLGAGTVVSAEQDPFDLFSDLYRGGFEGGIGLGAGDDLLEFSIADAANDVTGRLFGDDGYDTLVLGHLTAAETTIEAFSGAYGDGYRIVDGYQTLELYGFEEILLGDGTNPLLV